MPLTTRARPSPNTPMKFHSDLDFWIRSIRPWIVAMRHLTSGSDSSPAPSGRVAGSRLQVESGGVWFWEDEFPRYIPSAPVSLTGHAVPTGDPNFFRYLSLPTPVPYANPE